MAYSTWHDHLAVELGKASARGCAEPECRARAEKWCLQPDAPLDLLRYSPRGLPFVEDVAYYSPMCDSHHTHLDHAWKAARRALEDDPGSVLPGLESVHGLVALPSPRRKATAARTEMTHDQAS